MANVNKSFIYILLIYFSLDSTFYGDKENARPRTSSALSRGNGVSELSANYLSIQFQKAEKHTFAVSCCEVHLNVSIQHVAQEKVGYVEP